MAADKKQQGKKPKSEDTRPIDVVQNEIRRARKRGQKVSRGRHVETMTSGLIADELKRRKEIADAAVIQLKADAVKLQNDLNVADKSRRGPISAQLSATLSAVPVVEGFGANPLMKFRDRSYAIRQLRPDNVRAGIVARNALVDADKEYGFTL